MRNGQPVTEDHVSGRSDLDLRSTLDLVELINEEDAGVPAAVRSAARPLAAAIDAIAERLESGGRLIYVGAGSSGRLAAVDAAECGPTFGVPPEQMVVLVAGGVAALAVAQEAAEDDEIAGARDVEARERAASATPSSCSRRAAARPTWSAPPQAARRTGALTVALVCADDSELGHLAEHEVAVVVGPEVIAGSTRMKAGTAQKLLLNTISTVTMVRLGKTYGNLMVDVVASNAKLRESRPERRRDRDRRARGGGRCRARGLWRRRQGRDRLAARRPRRRRSASEARRRRRRRAPCARGGSGAVRLGVEAAIVEGELLRGDIEVADGKIVSVGLAPKRGGGIAAPGFVDLQVNGYAGVDFAAADAAGYATRRRGAARGRRHRVPADPDHRARGRAARRVAGGAAGRAGGSAHPRRPPRRPVPLAGAGSARIPRPRGAIPTQSCSNGCSRQARCRYMTLAPELPGALELVDLLHARGIVVSCGHTDATAAEAHAAFDRGVGTVTHLFNAMRPLGHRDPGIAGAALVRDDVIVQVILDGHHLAAGDGSARLADRRGPRRARHGRDRGCRHRRDDSTRLSGIDVEIRDGIARRADGVLAGSVVTMIESVRNLHALGAPLVDAIAAATSAPARAARRPGLGVLEPGGEADIVVLDDRLEIRTVLRAGLERVAA